MGKSGKPRSLPTAYTPMTKSGHCQFPSEGSHDYCASKGFNCSCSCHAGKGTGPEQQNMESQSRKKEVS